MSLRPRLRPLELFPVDADGEVIICVRDPSGLAERAFLRRPAAFLAILCDGTRTIAEVAQEFTRRTGVAVTDAVVENMVGQLDDALFLEGPRLIAARQAVADEFRASPHRPAAHAGACYPEGGEELRAYLAAFEAKAEPSGVAPRAEPLAGLVVPHIDFNRGGPVYARVYRALGEPPDLVVVFGTDHNAGTEPFSLTRKPYATPLGEVPTDVALVDALAAELGDWVFADELHHKHEHSIEFQAVWLRYLYGERTPPILPVLCGSLHREVERGGAPDGHARRAAFLDALARAVAGRRVLVVAGADMAHVGPHFGDAESMGGAEARARVEAEDRAALAAAATGDAAAFFAAVAAVKDRNRVCGLAPIWATLRLLGPRRGVLLDYAQCAADPTDDSFVSIASLTLM
jgi:AmmeMemoRadiSam system protein B